MGIAALRSLRPNLRTLGPRMRNCACARISCFAGLVAITVALLWKCSRGTLEMSPRRKQLHKASRSDLALLRKCLSADLLSIATVGPHPKRSSELDPQRNCLNEHFQGEAAWFGPQVDSDRSIATADLDSSRGNLLWQCRGNALMYVL